MGFENKVFAVTGAGSGMGAAVCRLLADRGARAVCASDISQKGLETLKESIAQSHPATQVHISTLDVSKSEKVDEWIRSIVDTFGELHGAANVAGIPQAIGIRNPPNILGETDEDWSRIHSVNYDGVFYCTRAEIRAMKALNQQDRAIVNISSIASYKHDPDIYAYRGSKAACAHFTQSVAKDTQKLGIRINCVSPASTVTPMLEKFTGGKASQIEEWKSRGWDLISPEDVARVVVWLLSEDSSAVFGANINVGGPLP